MRILGNAGTGPHLSRPDDEGYVEAVGERMALVGRARLECWMWPVLLVEELELRVRRAGELVPVGPRTVHVVPEGLALAWEYGEFTLALEAFACRRARGLVLLVSLAAEAGAPGDPGDPDVPDVPDVPDADVEVELRFRPALRPMWPAGLGGELSGRDPETGALFLSEELGRFAALLGSPAARVADAEPGCDPDRGLRGTVALAWPGAALRERPAPVVVAGTQRAPAPLSPEARRGGAGSARGGARAEAALAEARALYRALLDGWPGELAAERARWRAWLARTARLQSDDRVLERAFLWSKIAIERAWVEVDGVGRSLVAGLGPSHGGARPGLAWFFPADALVATRALAALGDREGCRAVLRHAASTQRADGKIAHEITLSAGLCDWIGDYPYAYYKGQVTPGFVGCLAHHVALAGDDELAAELWPSALRAIEWCASTCDREGRMLVPEAGIAAVEAGALAGRIESEVYLQGIWVSALAGAADLARRVGDAAALPRIEELGRSAAAGLESFRRPDGRLAFARLAGGGTCDDLSAYVALPLARFGGPGALDQNRPEVMADWGARMFAETSSVYEPRDYNTGSVFPYLTGFSVLALFRAGAVDAAWQVLGSLVALDGLAGLGYLVEYLPGDRPLPTPRAVPHQVFSHSALLQGVVFGALGLRAAAPGLDLAPALSATVDELSLSGLCAGGRTLAVRVARERRAGSSRLVVEVEATDGRGPLPLRLAPLLPPLTLVEAATLDGEPIEPAPRPTDCGAFAVEARRVAARARLAIEHRAGPQLDLPAGPRGDGPSASPRLVGERVAGGALTWELAGRAGTRARIPLRCDRELLIRGGSIEDHHLLVEFPPGAGFTTATVILEPA